MLNTVAVRRCTIDGYFIGGDIAVQDEADFIKIVGRAKDLIISGGYDVFPKEIEMVIDAIEGVAESAVIGVAHPDFGEGVVAVVAQVSERRLELATIVSKLTKEIAISNVLSGF